MPDIERLLTRVHQKSANAREFLTLISAFERIEQYFADRALDNTNDTTDSFQSSFLKELFAHPPPLAESLKRVRATFKGFYHFSSFKFVFFKSSTLQSILIFLSY